jgi:anti-sigma B factor antagonist
MTESATGGGPRAFAARADHHGEVLLITIVGDLDVYTSPSLRRLLSRSARLERDVVFDLGEVSFVDSSGLAAIAAAANRARIHGHAVGVVATNPVLLRILTIVRLDTQCTIDRTIDAVCGALSTRVRPSDRQEER